MQKLLIALLTLLAFGLLYVLHEHAQTNRFQSNSAGDYVLDSKTGAVYGMPPARGGEAILISAPIKSKP